jgi:hypothetical protein
MFGDSGETPDRKLRIDGAHLTVLFSRKTRSQSALDPTVHMGINRAQRAYNRAEGYALLQLARDLIKSRKAVLQYVQQE